MLGQHKEVIWLKWEFSIVVIMTCKVTYNRVLTFGLMIKKQQSSLFVVAARDFLFWRHLLNLGFSEVRNGNSMAAYGSGAHRKVL